MASANEIQNSAMSCLTCETEFNGNLNAFIDHMTDAHSDDTIQCVCCGELSPTGAEYAMHFIYSHTGERDDRNSASFDQSSSQTSTKEEFICPTCGFSTADPVSLASHFDTVHSGGGESYSSSAGGQCPVCSQTFLVSALNDHVNSHFDQASSSAADGAGKSDYQLALELDRQEREARNKAESKEFELLQREYGMDESGSYKQQGLQALNRAYGKGQMTIGQLYDAKERLRMNESDGIEDPNHPTKCLVEKIGQLSRRCPDVLDVHLCTSVDHYSFSPADTGFGCGYRNIQMMLSSLRHCEMYRKALWGSGPVHIPSIPKLQGLIESAWEKGFDSRGCAQLNGRLKNTRKWIGTTEAAVFLLSYRVKVQLIDIHAPSGPNSTHPQMLRWCYDYFKEGTAKGTFTPPLYFQHEGHSRTVVGVERTRSGQFRLLILDPSHSRQKMQQFASSSNISELRLIRKTAKELTKPKYQLLVIRGLIESDQQYEWYKSNFDHIKLAISGR